MKIGCGSKPLMESGYGLVPAALFLLLLGCAEHAASMGPAVSPVVQRASSVLVADAFTNSSTTSLVPAGRDESSEEPVDPFAKPGEEVLEEYDPWEPFNSKVFEFNRQFDRLALKPFAKGYNFVVPNFVQVGIGNFFYNARATPRFLNNIFQGKFKGAGIEVGRFLINTTAGLAGFVDVAQRFDLTTPEEDTGQTLGFYGVSPGPYIVLPFMQPYTLRDLVGYVGDIALNPIFWFVFPIIEIDAIPSVIPHHNRLTATLILLTARATEIVNNRSLNLEKYEGVEESTLDLYAAVRNAYLQTRARAVRE
jgi:phospholipid-binding lipoprotein MlaA